MFIVFLMVLATLEMADAVDYSTDSIIVEEGVGEPTCNSTSPDCPQIVAEYGHKVSKNPQRILRNLHAGELMPKINTSVLMVNESCLSVDWEIPTDFLYYDCIQHIQVYLLQQDQYSILIEERLVDKHPEDLQLFCQLEPNTTYEANVAVVSDDGNQLSVIDVTTITTPSVSTGSYFPVGDLSRTDLITGLLFALVLLLIMFGSLLTYMKWHPKKWRSRRRSWRPSKAANKHAIPVSNLWQVVNQLGEKYLKKEFNDLSCSVDSLIQRDMYTMTAAMEVDNLPKNRYRNILPFDHSRVKLNSTELGYDYINASYLEGYNRPREYIACQGPLSSTLADFWQMIWEQGVLHIVMVTSLEADGYEKCAQYWPDLDESILFGDVVVTTICETQHEYHTSRSLQVTSNTKESRLVEQIHIKDWPDHGCPSDPEILVRVIEIFRFSLVEDTTAPVVVHCSAGVGRTGTFIAVDCLMQEATASDTIDVFESVLKLRSNRNHMVQNLQQYEFIYKCISHFVATRLPFSASELQNSINDLQVARIEESKESFVQSTSIKVMVSDLENLK